ncbi:MAG: DUF3644 domain-containing protein [Dehalococcoidia bacterium]|nr:DUF3644 domain-containing protein [Dehalococcoidia bacterium]
MARPSRSSRLQQRADAALLAAVEIFNKPDFLYREEAFAILVLNGWELLLKARILQGAQNDVRVLYVYERRRTRTGALSRKLYVKPNRSGGPHTIGLGEALSKLGSDVPTAVVANLEALTEIRDNATHFMNISTELAHVVLEIGTAAVRNYIELSQRWFHSDFGRFNLYLMPIGLVASGVADAVFTSPDEQRLLTYLRELASSPTSHAGVDFHVAIAIDIRMRRSPGASVQVGITDDPSAPVVQVSEESIRLQYPWTYRDLSRRLRERYLDFKENQAFHDIRKAVEEDSRYSHVRYLDPQSPAGGQKRFFNPNILSVFDQHYTRQ